MFYFNRFLLIKNKYHKMKSVTPFSIQEKNVKKSPFKTIAKCKETLQKWKQGENIGFTYIASLKSMGLIPRSNGYYMLGSKYEF